MIKNVVVPFIEVEDCKDVNIHAFEIVNTDWVPENTVLRRPRISEAARMASLCFLNRGVPRQHNLACGIPEGANPTRKRKADQRFGLGYQPNKRIIVGLLIGEGQEGWLELKEEILKKNS